MEYIKDKKHGLMIMIALMFTTAVGQVTATYLPALTEIYAAFPDTSAFWQAFINTGPSLIAIPFLLASGIFARYINKRKLLIINMVIFLIGIVVCICATNVTMLIIGRVVSGVPAITILVPTLALIPELWTEEAKMSRVMGFYFGASGFFSAAWSFIAGFIALAGWRYVFMLNLICILPLLMVIKYVPATPLERKETVTVEADQEEKANIKGFVLLMASLAVMSMFGYSIYYLMSLYVAEANLGGSVFAGIVLTALGIIVAVFSFIFGPIYVKMKKWLHPICFLGIGLVYLLFAIKLSQIAVIAAVIVFSIFLALVIAYYPTRLSAYVPASRLSMFTGIYETVTYGFQFLCAYVPLIIGTITGNSTIMFTNLAVGIIVTIIGIIITLVVIFDKGLFPKTDS